MPEALAGPEHRVELFVLVLVLVLDPDRSIEITRTAVGEFALDQAVALADFETASRAGKAGDWILPLGDLLPLAAQAQRRRPCQASS